MPSPFAGMDPHLEAPGLWPDVHAQLISEVQGELNRQITPRYVARVEQRVFTLDENDPCRRLNLPAVRFIPARGHAATIAGPQLSEDDVPSFDVTTEIDEEIVESFVRVYDRRDRSVVTLIEVMSPANKTPGSAGRRA